MSRPVRGWRTSRSWSGPPGGGWAWELPLSCVWPRPRPSAASTPSAPPIWPRTPPSPPWSKTPAAWAARSSSGGSPRSRSRLPPSTPPRIPAATPRRAHRANLSGRPAGFAVRPWARSQGRAPAPRRLRRAPPFVPQASPAVGWAVSGDRSGPLSTSALHSLAIRRGTLNEHLLGTPPGLAHGRVPADVLAVGLHVPRRAVVLFVGAQDVRQLGLDGRVAEGGDSRHPPGEVACHQVGRADEELGRATVLETVDPAVLKESAEGAVDLDRR